MLWEIEIRPRGHDAERDRVCAEYNLLTGTQAGAGVVTGSARGYLLEGDVSRADAEILVRDLLVDDLVETGRVGALGEGLADCLATVLTKPDIVEPAARTVIEAARDLGIQVRSVRLFRRYFGPALSSEQEAALLPRIFAREVIEQVVREPLALEHLAAGEPYRFRLVTVRLADLAEAGLEKLSRDSGLSLNMAEMRAIQQHFQGLERDPTDVELKTLAQTWSEHVSHKTLKDPIDFEGRRIDNLLRETIVRATQEIRLRLGDDWCVSSFEEVGVVRFDERYHLCVQVETPRYSAATEPYGSASACLGDALGAVLATGLGAKPIANLSVCCLAPPDTLPLTVPAGVLPPCTVLHRVVAGVGEYGNRVGIPTVCAGLCFEDRYRANPLLFCGTAGLLPKERCRKAAADGDLLVTFGGRTGRAAVPIGNAVTAKKLLDVLLQARDHDLYHALTNCRAGGFCSAIGKMAEKLGVRVQLDQVPLENAGLSYTEIWLSESPERMILAVAPDKWPGFHALCVQEDVEATIIGRFEPSGRLRLDYAEQQVGDLDLQFLHHGRPVVARQASGRAGGARPLLEQSNRGLVPPARPEDVKQTLHRILASPNVCSKEWVVRHYDHEVQGGSVIKPLVGVHKGSSDAAVLAPVLGSWVGLAIGYGLNPHDGDLDAYAMAAATIDEAVRNVVAVGADPAHVALVAAFSWGDTDRPEVLGSLVRTAEACRDVALAYGTPFLSATVRLDKGDRADQPLVFPPTLLISALARVADVRRCVSMDLKEPGNLLFLLGVTKNEMGGGVPHVDLDLAPRLLRPLHDAVAQGLVRSCHDLGQGGLAVALAEMAMAGDVGADVTGLQALGLPDAVALFAESTTRFVVEVAPAQAAAFEACIGKEIPLLRLGQTVKEPRLRIAGASGEWIIGEPLSQLREAWQKPLRV
jgi:phosphoribosylformylglycinamidine synthase